MTQSIPNYELYGEFLAGRAPGPIHHETIRERSQRFDWTIRLHRHRRLAQIFLFRSPGVAIRLGDVRHTTTCSTILAIPPGIPHGFRFDEEVVGDVLSIRLDEMPVSLRARFTAFQTPTNAIFQRPETKNFEDVATLFDQLTRAYHSIDAHRAKLVFGLVDIITLLLTSSQQNGSTRVQMTAGDSRGRKDVQIEGFCELLEENFNRPWAVSDYADRIGLSASHLTRVCRDTPGAPPNELVRQRRILEAKRLLEYTAVSIAEIAHRCGFRDAAFFSRTFKASVGLSPKAYRLGLER